jgi:hypothetical protein
MRRLALLLFAAALVPLPAQAQTAEQLLVQARSAFDNLDFEAAARLYLRALDISVSPTREQRDTAQLYLGVSYEYAGQRVNSTSAFRVFIRDNPCAPTPEVFGPGVTQAYVEARSGLFAAGLCALVPQRLATGDTAVFRVAATRAVLVRLLLRDAAGAVVLDFGDRTATGVQDVRWTLGASPSAFGAEPRDMTLVMEARERDGGATDQRTYPVRVHAPSVDTLAHPLAPSQSLLRPERRPMGAATGDLVKGLAFGAGAAVAATTLAHKSLGGETVKAAAIGGTMSLVGVIGFFKASAGRDIPENRAFNEGLRRTWRAAADSVMAENRRRLATQVLIIEPSDGRP